MNTEKQVEVTHIVEATKTLARRQAFREIREWAEERKAELDRLEREQNYSLSELRASRTIKETVKANLDHLLTHLDKLKEE